MEDRHEGRSRTCDRGLSGGFDVRFKRRRALLPPQDQGLETTKQLKRSEKLTLVSSSEHPKPPGGGAAVSRLFVSGTNWYGVHDQASGGMGLGLARASSNKPRGQILDDKGGVCRKTLPDKLEEGKGMNEAGN